eukprot:TRINITY_DN15467_c0_g2_i2.p1 TRINITY_DN15467_c0_g2~~TRINITY_DN15467_c0_g2_i2.p1  ORF type:complete len:373 (-),score=102.60 TRINITY_DN15467_c0_g2_i2:78-1154(-)
MASPDATQNQSKRKLSESEGNETGAKRSRTETGTVLELEIPSTEAEAFARRVTSESSLVAGVCPDFLQQRPTWTRLTDWAQKLCRLGDAAKDELLYWETYMARPQETGRGQLLRQVREDFEDMAVRLEEAGVTVTDAAVAREKWAVDAICELIEHLLKLLEEGSAASKGSSESSASIKAAEGEIPAPPEQRFFAVRIDICQEGCSKFHDDSRFTPLRLVLPILGPGPVLATSEQVDWTEWDKEAGLLEQIQEGMTPEDAAKLIREWNEKICPPAKETKTAEGSLVILKGGALAKRPLLHRATYCPVSSQASEPLAQLVITFDHVTAEVRDQLIDMNLDSEEEDGDEEDEVEDVCPIAK